MATPTAPMATMPAANLLDRRFNRRAQVATQKDAGGFGRGRRKRREGERARCGDDKSEFSQHGVLLGSGVFDCDHTNSVPVTNYLKRDRIQTANIHHAGEPRLRCVFIEHSEISRRVLQAVGSISANQDPIFRAAAAGADFSPAEPRIGRIPPSRAPIETRNDEYSDTGLSLLSPRPSAPAYESGIGVRTPRNRVKAKRNGFGRQRRI
jgi:hypothetical protein